MSSDSRSLPVEQRIESQSTSLGEFVHQLVDSVRNRQPLEFDLMIKYGVSVSQDSLESFQQFENT